MIHATNSSEALLAMIRSQVIGERRLIDTPFGPRPLVYADYIASGRALTCVEELVTQRVLPVYGNTHTETSQTGRDTTALREEARAVIAEAVGAGPHHAVIFTGNGATAAVDRLVRGMEITELARAGRAPVVFVGPYEHHSNDLPWRESGAVIERIGLTAEGQIDLEKLADRLAVVPADRLKIGAFSAASNVTGVRSDLVALARVLHRHGARFICDFAAAAPYIEMKLTPDADDPSLRIDALFYSSHKFVGGPGASGVLVADKTLFTSSKPAVTGGGTVSYVTADHHRYVTDLERREEAGTPGIVGDIRAGAVMALKEAVGAAEIERCEEALMGPVMDRLRRAEGVEILGPQEAKRIGVLAFNLRSEGRVLHYGFVVALLNDLFGIQARGGCSCAGPYAHELLHILPKDAAGFEGQITHGRSLMRPGWVRLGVNYFFDPETVDYLTEAILFIQAHGVKFLSDYEVDVTRGVWRHKASLPRAKPGLRAFWQEAFAPAAISQEPLATALEQAEALARQRPLPHLTRQAVFDEECECLRDFWLPQEAMVTAAE